MENQSMTALISAFARAWHAGHAPVPVYRDTLAERLLGPDYAACAGETDGVWSVDLWQANRLLLLEAGLAPDHVEVTTSCAFSEADKFFSYRRDGGHTGRMGAFAVL